MLARGFVSLSADELARVLYAADWAVSPYVFGNGYLWLPGHFYFLGLALRTHNDLFLTPHIVTITFSLISLMMLYLLARYLFNRWVALMCVLIVGLLPLHVHLSLIPLVDILYFTFTLSFLDFFLLWLDDERDQKLLLAALMLSVATSLRYEAWIMAAVFSLYLAICGMMTFWRRRSLRLLWLMAIVLFVCCPAYGCCEVILQRARRLVL